MNPPHETKWGIHTDPTLLRPGQPLASILYPFAQELGDAQDRSGEPRYAEFFRQARAWMGLVELPRADLAVLPFAWEHVRRDAGAAARARAFVGRARAAGKPVLGIDWSDDAGPLGLDGCLVLRTSLWASERRAGEFCMPAFVDDLSTRVPAALRYRTKQRQATVGFCGFAPRPRNPLGRVARLGRRAAGALAAVVARHPAAALQRLARSHRPGAGYTRGRAVEALRRSGRVAARVIERPRFWGALSTAEAQEAHRREYVDNMVHSDYVLCARGAGNFSYRLFEVLSCGRIPVFVNTDCVLPLDWRIPWRDLVVWVEEHDLESVGDRVADHYERLTDAAFVRLQRECARVWREYLVPEAFFRHFLGHVSWMTGTSCTHRPTSRPATDPCPWSGGA